MLSGAVRRWFSNAMLYFDGRSSGAGIGESRGGGVRCKTAIAFDGLRLLLNVPT